MAHNVRRLLQEVLGDSVPTDLQSSDVTVTATPIQLVPANARRAILRICNQGTANINIAFSAALTSQTAFGLAPGDTMIWDYDEDLEDVTRVFWAVADLGSNPVHITETILTGVRDAGNV